MRRRRSKPPLRSRSGRVNNFRKNIPTSTNRIQLNIPDNETSTIFTTYGGWSEFSLGTQQTNRKVVAVTGLASSKFSRVGKLEISSLDDENKAESYYFINEPSVNLSSNGCVIKSKVIEKKFDSNGRCIYYCIDILSKTTSKASTISVANVNYQLKKIKEDKSFTKTKTLELTSFNFNNKPIISTGETRSFTLTGSPGSSYCIAINETKPTEITDFTLGK